MTKKVDYKKLEEKVTKQKKSCWDVWDDKTKKDSFDFAEKYKDFLNKAKTERESVKVGIEMAKKRGFVEISKKKSLKTGDKVYVVNRDKNLFLAVIGKDKINKGLSVIMSHVDSPHLDFKSSPLYEDEGVAFLKTHYYGGIKKYQWPTIALALHGIVCLKNGDRKEIVIGEKESDPVFMITDLLPHLDRAGGPGSKVGNREILGEDLNMLVGSIPVKDDKIKNRIKLAILEYLHNKYGIVEEDFYSAELQAVPSEKARDIGFDRSLISAYGHDDRSCSFASLQAFFDSSASKKTKICFWVDREEIGSDGNTGAKSFFVDSFVSELLRLSKLPCGLNDVYKLFSLSQGISSDVTAAVDPDYKDVHDLNNAHRMGFGVAMEKYTGSGGKYSTSEASAEYVARLRSIFSRDKNVVYQVSGGIGKIDVGGGGTIAKYMANRNLDIVDIGVPLFNMHAPLEIVSKADLYASYLVYKLFFSFN